MINSRSVIIAATVGTILQVVMVVLGHTSPSIKALFAAGGMGLSLLAGLIYALNARGSSVGSLAIGGAIAGGICAIIGILVSHLLGDVPASLLLLGTVSSIVTGAIGGAIGKFFSGAVAVAMFVALSTAPVLTAKAQPVATTKDFGWLVLDAYEQSFKQALRLKSHSSDKDGFENMVPCDKALMSTQPRFTTFQRFDADTFSGHSDIIGDDGKPAVIEVKYHRLATTG